MKYYFKTKSGRFSKPSMRGKVFNGSGKQLFGNVKKSVIQAYKRKTVKGFDAVRKIRISTPSKKRESGITGTAFKTSVPKNLTSSFKWFVENSGNVRKNDKRPLYAIIELSGSFTYKSEERVTAFKKDYLVPLRLTFNQAKSFRAGKLDIEKVLAYAKRSGISKAVGVVSVVVKRPMKEIRKKSYLNPLFTPEQKKKVESKRRNTLRKRFK